MPSVREILSLDTWPVLSRLERTMGGGLPAESPLQPLLVQVQESLLALTGIAAQNMIRDASWAYLDAGAHLERVQHTLMLFSSTLTRERPPVIEAQVVEAVLMAGESIITHRRRLATGIGPSAPVESAVDILLLDPTNPRSVAHQLDRLLEDLSLVDDDANPVRVSAIRNRLAQVDLTKVASSSRVELRELLGELSTSVSELSRSIRSRHFAKRAPQRRQRYEWSVGNEAARSS